MSARCHRQADHMRRWSTADPAVDTNEQGEEKRLLRAGAAFGWRHRHVDTSALGLRARLVFEGVETLTVVVGLDLTASEPFSEDLLRRLAGGHGRCRPGGQWMWGVVGVADERDRMCMGNPCSWLIDVPRSKRGRYGPPRAQGEPRAVLYSARPALGGPAVTFSAVH